MKSYKNTPRRRSRYQKDPSDSLAHIFLFYILPFIVFNGALFFCVTATPALEVTVEDTADYLSTNISVSVTSLFPSREPSVTIDGEALELTKDHGRTYTAAVYKNGSIEANVHNLNGMSATVFEQVSILDDTPPSMEDTSIADGVVTLTVMDSQSGVDFDSIYATTSEEEPVEPLTVDRSTNTLSYEIGSGGLHVYAKDKAGNQVHGTFTSHKEGDVERLESTMEEQEVSVESSSAEAALDSSETQAESQTGSASETSTGGTGESTAS